MINRATSHFLVLLFVCILGCMARVTTTTGTGDSVTNQNGKGTGTVAGVLIEVQGLKDGRAGITQSVKVAQGSTGASESTRWDIDFGEVHIDFEREDDAPISLTVDGQGYGTVDKGDRLLIDESRDVFVNDEKRDAAPKL